MSSARVSTIHVGVRDLATMRAFYGALGWTEANPNNPDIAEFRGGGAWLSLIPHGTLAAASGMAEATQPDYRGLSLGYQAKTSEEVDDLLGRIAEAGGVIQKPAAATPWGGYSGSFLDPEGNLWEAAWHPRRQLDERGGLVG